MSNFFTQYWRNDTLDAERDRGKPRLNHTAGNEFVKRGVIAGDFIYVVTVIDGTLYLVGRTKVKGIYRQAAAERMLRQPNLWEAKEHVIEVDRTGTLERFDLAIPAATVRKLRFIASGVERPPLFMRRNILDTQTMRGVRKITSESARLLDEFLGGGPGSREDRLPEEVTSPNRLVEGAAKKVWVNAYERNRRALNACVQRYGAKCGVCGFEFSAVYGSIGDGFIHVHHLELISSVDAEYVVDPVRDLRPVCPNCHAMLHVQEPPFSIAELKDALAAARRGS